MVVDGGVGVLVSPAMIRYRFEETDDEKTDLHISYDVRCYRYQMLSCGGDGR